MVIRKVFKFANAPKNKFINKYSYKLGKLFINIVYPLYCYSKESGINKDSKIIISLTSYPDRVNTLWLVINTLLSQTIKPYRVILWLAKDQFEGVESLPKKLLKLMERGLEIRFCDNIGPHKKYYYTMENYPNYTVITVDDDTFYPEDLIEILLDVSNRHPKNVCCTWSHNITFDQEKNIKKYIDWKGSTKYNIPCMNILPVGCGGVLYPPYCLNNEVFNKNKLIELAYSTDDLWLKTMEVLNDTKAVRVFDANKVYFNIIKTQKKGLHYSNVGENKNDVNLKRIIKNYPEFLKRLIYAEGKSDE